MSEFLTWLVFAGAVSYCDNVKKWSRNMVTVPDNEVSEFHHTWNKIWDIQSAMCYRMPKQRDFV